MENMKLFKILEMEYRNSNKILNTNIKNYFPDFCNTLSEKFLDEMDEKTEAPPILIEECITFEKNKFLEMEKEKEKIKSKKQEDDNDDMFDDKAVEMLHQLLCDSDDEADNANKNKE
tara:strand:- start:135 stop:485 length:351 start_codon:yes stop_codon:yes gene_type:complete